MAAHAFGARYDLPLPLDLFLLGAGGAVALSFVVLALFFRVPQVGYFQSLSLALGIVRVAGLALSTVWVATASDLVAYDDAGRAALLRASACAASSAMRCSRRC